MSLFLFACVVIALIVAIVATDWAETRRRRRQAERRVRGYKDYHSTGDHCPAIIDTSFPVSTGGGGDCGSDSSSSSSSSCDSPCGGGDCGGGGGGGGGGCD